jgi:hypothetical protein
MVHHNVLKVKMIANVYQMLTALAPGLPAPPSVRKPATATGRAQLLKAATVRRALSPPIAKIEKVNAQPVMVGRKIKPARLYIKAMIACVQQKRI